MMAENVISQAVNLVGLVFLLGLAFHAGIMHSRVRQLAVDQIRLEKLVEDQSGLPVVAVKVESLERRLTVMETKMDRYFSADRT